jgi:hypothetical protein
MGYHMHQTAGRFTIRAANIPKALETAIEVGVPDPREGLSGTPAEQLADLFKAWRWEITFDNQTGDVSDIQFEGEKYHDDDELFRGVAPYVEAGSFICMHGDDDETWRWYFDGQEMITQSGTVTYELAKVVVEMRGGVAEVTECPPGIDVEIIDHDQREAAHDDRAA